MEPFKNLFSFALIENMGDHLLRKKPGFDRTGFISHASDNLETLELKERSRQITAALKTFLPGDFGDACEVLLASLHPDKETSLADMSSDANGLRGWAIMPMADYVAERGLDDFDRLMDVLMEMTMRSSSEFAVRPFISANPDQAMEHLLKWAGSKNTHVRRLASEGSRPRLPWGMRLQIYVDNPQPLMPLLNSLRDDPEEYVRRSVANNLNDIAKDHPDLVALTARNWLAGASKDRARLVKHACRTLVKQGHKPTLDALGFGPADISVEGPEVLTSQVRFGGALEFGIDLKSEANLPQDLVLDYVVHHRKANGQTSPKVFKWKVLKLAAGKTLTMKRKHPMRPITTRKYYDGTHRVEILINGETYGGADFELTGT